MLRGLYLTSFASVLLALATGAPARASHPVGVFALVDKVVLEPSAKAPERVQIWGAFSLANLKTRHYDPPVRGYLYYSAPAGEEETARTEWADLERVAGTGECVAFGARHTPFGKVRRADRKPESPDPYPLGVGVVKVRNSEFEPVAALLALPAPLAPAEAEKVPVGAVTLTARNAARKEWKGARYVFEIRGAGDVQVSPEIDPGKKETRWTPPIELKPGERYTWRVWVVDGGKHGPAAEARFEAKGKEAAS
jgi:hypothetical protein